VSSLLSFNDPALAKHLLAGIHTFAAQCGLVKIMEVCGTHTMEIGRLGLRPLLPANVTLISGPGCPVCVTPGSVIDAAATCALDKRVTVLTFGDMVRVPGNVTSLAQAKTSGAAVEVVTSPLQCIDIALAAPQRRFLFIAVGFETTIPAVARAVVLATERKIDNLTFLVCHRTVPRALDVLCADPAIGISGFLLPGHVSAILGESVYAPLARQGFPAAITGFEPLDILGGIHAVLAMIATKKPAISNMYPRVVRPEGNIHARELIEEIFEPVDALWRGIGIIPGTGLALRSSYRHLDAVTRWDLRLDDSTMPAGCSCGSVLRGIISPDRCPLFASVCTPESPVGPCMVSSEGSCAAYFKYETWQQ
jgi:hydrogenase expression/formation protein HypD